jgi:hypothetical protein
VKARVGLVTPQLQSDHRADHLAEEVVRVRLRPWRHFPRRMTPGRNPRPVMLWNLFAARTLSR